MTSLILLFLAALLVLTLSTWRIHHMSTTQVSTLITIAQQVSDRVLALQTTVSAVGASVAAEIKRVEDVIVAMQGQDNPALNAAIDQLQGVNSNLQTASDTLTAAQQALDAERPTTVS